MKFLPEFSVRNPVAANLLMVFLVVVGLYYATTLTREFFPPTDVEIIYVGMTYPGSTPSEVEKGIAKRLEDAIIDLEGVDKMTSNITEGNVGIIIEVESDADKGKLVDDIKRDVDRITDFPEEALEPIVVDIEWSIPVISVVVFGDSSERRLKEVAEELKDLIRAKATVSNVERVGARNVEMSVEVDPIKLEQYNLTFGEVSAAIRRSNFDLPGGEIKSPTGGILVRTLGESDAAERLRGVTVRSSGDGSRILVDDVADVIDGFTEDKQYSFYQGKRAVGLSIFKGRTQDAIDISSQVRAIVDDYSKQYAGESIQFALRSDFSRYIRQRQNLLLRSGLQGLVLVFLCLAMFLDIRVALWTAFGLPVSFMGTFILMSIFGVTINMISLFGLIIVIGLIVDDAIVIGENVFRHYEEGMPAHRAAIEGAKEVTWPVIAAVMTTIFAFLPLIFIDGVIGDFLSQLPMVVCAALFVSLIEALIILPTHLSESLHAQRVRKMAGGSRWIPGWLNRFLDWKEDLLGRRLSDFYENALKRILGWRYVFIAGMIATLFITLGLVGSGTVKYVLFENNDSETVMVNLDMGPGTLAEETIEILRGIEEKAEKYGEVEGILSYVGTKYEGSSLGSTPATEGIGQLVIDLKSAEDREAAGLMASYDFLDVLREEVGPIPGAKSLKYAADEGGPPGGDIEIEMRAPDYETLQLVVNEVVDKLGSYEGATDIEDSMDLGKSEVRIRLLPEAEALGLTTQNLAIQVRGAFFGDEAQSLQRDREELKVYTRLKYDSRRSIEDLENLRIKTPTGERVPFREVAEFEMSRGYSALTRIGGQRAARITCKVITARANAADITNDITPFLDHLSDRYVGVSYEFSGEKKKNNDAVGSMMVGVPMALFAIYCLLAIIFHSYLQPLIIMAAIPFGVIGAIWGHPIMGFPIQMLSLIGMAALAGIVVNDSLILVDFVNEELRQGETDLKKAVLRGGRVRLRAILLTSLTTIFGLAPIMLERSFQAKFLIPMAISIAFGLAFATVITLILIPCLYMVVEDIRTFLNWLVHGKWERPDPIGLNRARVEDAITNSYEEADKILAERKGPTAQNAEEAPLKDDSSA